MLLDDLIVDMNVEHNNINKNKLIKQICRNCKEIGHNYYNCIKPITSSGIIAFRRDRGKIEYLLIRRKDTLSYSYLLYGKYVTYNKYFIQQLVDTMTNKEKYNILNKSFEEIWKDLWSDNFSYIKEKDEQTRKSKNKINTLINGVKYNNETYKLEELINKSKTNWNEPEWGFPKGKRDNVNETNIQCALREFEEETGYSSKKLDIIQNISPFNEYIIGSNLITYKHIYFVAEYKPYLNNDIKKSYQKTEVGDMQWFTLQEAVQKIRYYDKDRIDIIKSIDTIIKTYL